MKAMTCQQLGGPCDFEHRGETADEVIKALSREQDDLKKAAQGEKFDWTVGSQWITFLENGKKQLDIYIKEQDKILKEEKDPKRLEYQALRQQARLEEARAEFTKALELYEKALKYGFDDPALKKDYDNGSHESKEGRTD